MRLQYKHQKFQEDAAKAVVDVFSGQPYLLPSYLMDKDTRKIYMTLDEEEDVTCCGNHRIIPELSNQIILEHIHKIQKKNQIELSPKLEGTYNLTVEMETGVGKTYTYIKTIYELNKHYGWSKFIIIVPSIAVREGVYKSFQSTQEHFSEEYGKRIRYFIYNSTQLVKINNFASDTSINVMIINSQAFNARSKSNKRIYMKMDELKSRRPIDIIAKTNPIVIIDEPQSVEGKQTKKNLKEFHPLMILRYSATHRNDSIYNMVYRLDTMDAYNKKLVKKIEVKGIQVCGTGLIDTYIYFEKVNLSMAAPTATIQFYVKNPSGIKIVSRKVSEGFDLFSASGGMDAYKDNYIVRRIDGRDNSIEFQNGIKMYTGDVTGDVNEMQFRRIQIRETILSHIERERQLFNKGIKVLSLFFIDEVKHYRKYDGFGTPENGIFADMFEQEYEDIVKNLQLEAGENEYSRYLQCISAKKTHEGYFSVDKKGHMINSKIKHSETSSDDTNAYDLIMRNKELLLERDPEKSPVRFIFSHSALKEGWDNPNVFQICTLKQSSSDVRKRQEVGRGMRLCVNENGVRMDENVLGEDVHKVNILTVIASESYDQFAKGLQSEIAESIGDRPLHTYDGTKMRPDDARISSNTEHTADSVKSEDKKDEMFFVDFDDSELIKNCIYALNSRLKIKNYSYKIESGSMEEIKSTDDLYTESALKKQSSKIYEDNNGTLQTNVKYDLIGAIVNETFLTRKEAIQILVGIQEPVFNQFKVSPDEFIYQASKLIKIELDKLIQEHRVYKDLSY